MRYKGLEKNTNFAYVVFALSNLYMASRHLLEPSELLSNLVYGVSSGVPVWLICCPYTVFENDTFDNFADKIETLDTLPPLFS